MANAAELPADMDNSAESIIEALGGAKGIRTLLEDRQSMFVEFWAAYSSLLEQYPDKWVAWGKDGVIDIADSRDELLRGVRSRSLTANDVMVEYLDTDPKGYIL